MELGRFEQTWTVCTDQTCVWVDEPDHQSRHNPPCGELFVGSDSSEWMCGLLAGHDGAHRGDRVS